MIERFLGEIILALILGTSGLSLAAYKVREMRNQVTKEKTLADKQGKLNDAYIAGDIDLATYEDRQARLEDVRAEQKNHH